ncbi:DUF2238 domain-containing protein [Candidatus Saccharibacteria bacterium]|nr:DUF2238 domain-containing protein [Candidatus Saccharibacteria bacterium]
MKPQTTIKNFLKYGILITGAVLAIMHFIPALSESFPKIWSYLATMALPFGMDVLRFLGLKISKRFEIAYLLFIIPAMILGIDLDIYKIFYPFDKIVHCLSGVLAAFGAREIIEQASGKPDQAWFRALFSICFVAFTAAVWECFEFSCDQIAGQHMQELIAPGLSDTMWDIIVALIGGVVGTVLAFPAKRINNTKN